MMYSNKDQDYQINNFIPLKPSVKYPAKCRGLLFNSLNQLDYSAESAVLFGISGGLDSMVLYLAMKDYLSFKSPSTSLIPVHINNIELPSADLKELLRLIPDLVIIDDHFPLPPENSCYYCSRRRKKMLFNEAERRGCRVVVLAHNGSEYVETLLMNLFYSGAISLFSPITRFFGDKFVVHRPLLKLSRQRINKMARSNGLVDIQGDCPYKIYNHRDKIRNWLKEFERGGLNRPVPEIETAIKACLRFGLGG